MRIVFLIPWITKSRGGTENVGRLLANAMASYGHSTHVVTFDDFGGAPSWPLHSGVSLARVGEADNQINNQQLAIEIAQFNPDLIVGLHLNNTFKRYVDAARKIGVPLVLSEHIDPRFPARAGKFDPAMREVVFSGAQKIHLLSETFRGSLPERLHDLIEVIPNTCDEPESRATPGDTESGGIIVTVARLVPRKNVARLIRAFAMSRSDGSNWTLRVVGDGSERSNLEQLASSLKVAKHVDFVGHTENAYSYLQDAHIFALASLFEGFPMSSLEAMAHGLPLVGYGICNGLNEQIHHGQNGFLASGGSGMGNLPELLAKLMADAQLRKKMGQESLRLFSQEYSNKVIFDRWEDFIVRSAEQRSSPSIREVSIEDQVKPRNPEMIG